MMCYCDDALLHDHVALGVLDVVDDVSFCACAVYGCSVLSVACAVVC